MAHVYLMCMIRVFHLSSEPLIWLQFLLDMFAMDDSLD